MTWDYGKRCRIILGLQNKTVRITVGLQKKTVGLYWDYMSDYIWDYGLLGLYMGLHTGLRNTGIILGLWFTYIWITLALLNILGFL